MNKILISILIFMLLFGLLLGFKVIPIYAHNSFSWDTALFSVAVGGYVRRRSWGNPNYYIYDPNFNHHPLNLNHMKLYHCDLVQCDNPGRYYPTKGDKTAGDWIPAIPPPTNRKFNEK